MGSKFRRSIVSLGTEISLGEGSLTLGQKQVEEKDLYLWAETCLGEGSFALGRKQV